MDENVSTLEQAAVDILASALETVGAAKDFVLAELPDVVQQLLLWKMTESLIWFGFGVLMLLPVAVWWYKLPKYDWAYNYRERERGFDVDVVGPSAFVSCILVFSGLSFILGNLEWLQILIAPKLYLIEYASSLVVGS